MPYYQNRSTNCSQRHNLREEVGSSRSEGLSSGHNKTVVVEPASRNYQVSLYVVIPLHLSLFGGFFVLVFVLNAAEYCCCLFCCCCFLFFVCVFFLGGRGLGVVAGSNYSVLKRILM